MTTMNLILLVGLGVLMLAAAVFAVISKKVLSAIIAAGVVSLLASVIYLLLASPDVAMTEAAIGSGLTTVVFLYAYSRMKSDKEDRR